MAISLTHDFVSTVADQVGAPKIIKPTHWNDEHELTLATDKLIGRDTAGAGSAEEIGLGASLEFDGSGNIQRAALTGDVTASANGNTTTIANDAVTYAKMQNVSDTDKVLGRSTAGAGDVEEIPCTAFARSILDDANEATFKATVNLEAADILAALLTVDGAASGLDADLLDGNSSAFYATATGLSDHLADTADAHDASAISNVAAGNIIATDVQAALNELDTEKQPIDATLTALAAYNTNGLIAQTAADTFAGRTVTGTAAQISVANGDGVAGNPTLSLPADVLIPTVLTVPNVGLHLLDTNASHDLIVKPGSDLTADKTLTITTGDADRTVTLSGDTTLADWFDQSVKAAALPTFAGAALSGGTTTLGVVAGTINAGEATSLELPNAAAPTVNADGEIAVDTTVADFSHGIMKYYGGEELGVVAMPIAQFTSPVGGRIVAYNATNDEFELVAAGAGDFVGPASSTDNAAVRFDSTTGKLGQNSSFIIDDTGHVSSFGGNIAFPATQAASADANTLDDYEEGTWTPSLGGNTTYTAQVGHYRKIGSVVHIWCYVLTNVIGTGSTTTISGLPFTSAAGLGTAFTVGYFSGLATNVVSIAGFVDASASTLAFSILTAAAAGVTYPGAIFGSNTTIVVSGSYHV